MFLYGSILSPYVMRVILCARAKGMALSVKMPEGGSKSPEFLHLNPLGKVPTLVHNGFVLPESEIIIQYLEDIHPRPTILPDDPQERARARLISRLTDAYVLPQLLPAFREEAIDSISMRNALNAVEHFMVRDDTHAAGHGFSIADCTLIPILFFFDALQARHRTADYLTQLPRLGGYWQRAQLSEAGLYAIREMSTALDAYRKARAHDRNA